MTIIHSALRFLCRRHFVQPETAAKDMKLSEAINKGIPMVQGQRGSYRTCVLGTAYLAATGRELQHYHDSAPTNHHVRAYVARVFDVPIEVVRQAEHAYEVVGWSRQEVARALAAQGY